jgi:hypothetical protein
MANDYEVPWESLPPEQQEPLLAANRALFQDPNWEPPPGMMIPVCTIPAEMWDELGLDKDD